MGYTKKDRLFPPSQEAIAAPIIDALERTDPVFVKCKDTSIVAKVQFALYNFVNYFGYEKVLVAKHSISKEGIVLRVTRCINVLEQVDERTFEFAEPEEKET